MTQKEKQLLLKDLCARHSCRVIVNVIDNNDKTYSKDGTLLGITDTCSDCGGTPFLFKIDNQNCLVDITEIKPYLRPMSSMTEKEKEEFENLLEGIVDGIERWDKPDLCEEYDWLNAHHFDYRGLIEKGLALEAPEGMYDLKEK